MHGISKNAFIVLVNVADPFSLYTYSMDPIPDPAFPKNLGSGPGF